MLNRSTATSTILAVGSDADARLMVNLALRGEGHHVIEADSPEVALTLSQQYRPDVILLDITLTDMSGFDLCTRLRRLPCTDQTPILFISAYQSAQSVAQALDCGGDDYLRKPFAARELTARVRALLRRNRRRQFEDGVTLQLDAINHTVTISKQSVLLTPTEFQLLEFLCHNIGENHSANDLLEKVWNYPPGSGDTALVRNHIRNLRRKIEVDPDHPSIILSLHGRGYMVRAAVTM